MSVTEVSKTPNVSTSAARHEIEPEAFLGTIYLFKHRDPDVTSETRGFLFIYS